MKSLFRISAVIIAIYQLSAIAQGEIIELNKERSTYQLNFDVTYVLYISNDIETAITLPEGYKFTACVPGSHDFVSASAIQGTMYVSKPTTDDVLTNLTMHVLTPEGIEQKLVFKIIGKKSSPKVLSVNFEPMNSSEVNRTIEAMKATYQQQMNQGLSKQEGELNEKVHDNTMLNARPWFVKGRHGKVHADFNGAKCWIDGMINSRNATFIYVTSTIKKDECDIIQLTGIKIKKAVRTVELAGIITNDDQTYTYCYKTTPILFEELKDHSYKSIGIEYIFVIWSKTIKEKATIS